jgi:hypothetical protein
MEDQPTVSSPMPGQDSSQAVQGELQTPPANIPWSKATVEDKLERSRYYIKDLMEVLGQFQKKQRQLEADFYNHKHMDGMIVSQMSQFGNILGNNGNKPVDNTPDEEKWF